MTINPEIKSLAPYQQAIADEITIDSNGQGYISAKGTARLLGVATSTLGVARLSKKLAETLTQCGVNPVARPFNEVTLRSLNRRTEGDPSK